MSPCTWLVTIKLTGFMCSYFKKLFTCFILNHPHHFKMPTALEIKARVLAEVAAKQEPKEVTRKQ